MNIPVIVDIAIGLVFIYMILSLLASEIQELITTLLQWRAKHLKDSIINLLSGDTITDQNVEAAKALAKDIYNHPLFHDINQEARGLFSILFRKITWLFSWVYQSLTHEQKTLGNQVTSPSYIPGETFATALIERLGISKLIEPLTDYKLRQFKYLITQNIIGITGNEDIINSPEYQSLDNDLLETYQKFTDDEITLITAIDEISLRLDQFIHQLTDETQKQQLTTWKQGLFGQQNELALINGGLRPTLQELADLLDSSSKNYKLLHNELQNYFQQRNQQFIDKLQDFLLVLDTSICIIIDPSNNNFSTKEEILQSAKYTQICTHNLNTSETKISISLNRLNEEIAKAINSEIKSNRKPNINNQLKALKIGFSEQSQDLFYAKIFRWEEILPIVFLIIIIFITCLAVFPFRDIFIQTSGGIAFFIVIILFFMLFLWGYNWQQNFNKRDDKESLITPLDIYLSSGADIQTFIEDFRSKIQKLNRNPDKNLINWELNRLGQSFRQYYRNLVFNYADVDWPFIPSSVKQSVASLLRRAKSKVTRTGSEVNQVREEVEIWFDRSMERASGVYKRNAKGISILIGFFLAIFTNANSIHIVNRLAYDQELRETIVRKAEQTNNESYQEISQRLNEELSLPIGWNPRLLGQQLECKGAETSNDWKTLFDNCIQSNQKPEVYFAPTAIFVMILTSGKWQVAFIFLMGWFITAIAVSMGSAFWFEILGKLINVRNTGNKPPSLAKQTAVNSDTNTETN